MKDKRKKLKKGGVHLLAEFWHGKIIENKKEVKEILIEAAKAANNTPLNVSVYKFYPWGITGFALLTESHIALHSWPEFNYLAIDVFTCGKKAMPYKALGYLKKVFQPQKTEIKEIKRGIFKL